MRQLHYFAALLFPLCHALSTSAQTSQVLIPLDEDSISRLGIVFALPQRAAPDQGSLLPAQVTNSPDAMLEVITRYPGQLVEWHVQVGDDISANTVVATMEGAEILSLQNEWLGTLQQQRLARSQLAREEALYESGIIATQRIELARQEMAQANLGVARARAALRQLGVDDSGLTALEEGSALGQLQVKSPHAGRVAQRHQTVGSALPAMARLLTLSGDQHWVEAYVPTLLSQTLSPGTRLGLADQDVQLTLMSLDEQVDPGRQTRTLRARVDSAATPPLYPGQIVRLRLPVPEDALLIPAQSIVHHQGETLVYVRQHNGIEARTVILQPMGDSYLVQQGLNASERLAIQGTALLKGMQLELDAE